MREKEKENFPHKEEICILIMCVRLKEVWAEVESEGIKRLLRCFAFCCNPNSLFNKDYSKEWTQNGVCTGSSETSAFLFGILEYHIVIGIIIIKLKNGYQHIKDTKKELSNQRK